LPTLMVKSAVRLMVPPIIADTTFIVPSVVILIAPLPALIDGAVKLLA
jgi:hypothetical protein